MSYFLNHNGIWRESAPFISLSERGSGLKNEEKNDQKRQIYIEITKTAKRAAAPPTAKCALHVLKNKGFGVWRVAVGIPLVGEEGVFNGQMAMTYVSGIPTLL